jgi:hypothetical protein
MPSRLLLPLFQEPQPPGAKATKEYAKAESISLSENQGTTPLALRPANTSARTLQIPDLCPLQACSTPLELPLQPLNVC